MLLALADERAANALYQRFKHEVVAHVPEEGGVLSAEEVRAWVARAVDAQQSGDAIAGRAAEGWPIPPRSLPLS